MTAIQIVIIFASCTAVLFVYVVLLAWIVQFSEWIANRYNDLEDRR